MLGPLISVIIPVFNQARFITETVESVLSQSYSNFEIIIVDDGSTDNLREIVQRFIDADSRVSYYLQKNGGVSNARNNGFLLSKGVYVAFLDADDVWLADNIEVKVLKLRSGEYGLVHSDASVINGRSESVPGRLEGNEGDLLDAMLAWRATQVPGPSSILVRREVLEKVGLFDEQLSTSADQDFFIRVAAAFKVGRVDRITWKYRLHENNMHKNINRMEHDVQIVYQKAKEARLFHSSMFERQCFATMYLILAASWGGDGRNLRKCLFFTVRSIWKYPPVVFEILKRLTKKWKA